MKRVVIASGYFNPIHPGHIDYFRLASRLGDFLWVIVNNDVQAEKKRGTPSFQTENDRVQIVSAIKYVDETFLSMDKDPTVCLTIAELYDEACERYGSKNVELIFAKGGDRMASEIPEAEICNKLGIKIIDGLGAKTHNSSEYLKNK